MVTDIYKALVFSGELPRMSFWRDSTGHEVNLLVETGSGTIAIEISPARRCRTMRLEGCVTGAGSRGMRRRRRH